MRLIHAAGAAALIVVATLGSSAAERDVRLIEAVKNGNAATVQTLSRQRALVNVAEADGSTALHWAARPSMRC
jgi:ankyrin repeat protein